jgi:hypothetical protein
LERLGNKDIKLVMETRHKIGKPVLYEVFLKEYLSFSTIFSMLFNQGDQLHPQISYRIN